MRFMIPLLWAAGGVQLSIIAANFVLPKKLYYEYKDWPSGRGFILGHILLTTLFAFLAVTNLALFFVKV